MTPPIWPELMLASTLLACAGPNVAGLQVREDVP
jgi:hypothetical protein